MPKARQAPLQEGRAVPVPEVRQAQLWNPTAERSFPYTEENVLACGEKVTVC